MICLKTFLNASYPRGAYWKLKVFLPYYRSVRKLRKLRPNLENAVLIISFGRSGSTWVQESIAKLDDFLTVFEPLSVEFGNSIKDWISKENRAGLDFKDEKIQKFITGDGFNPWMNQLHLLNAREPKRLLVKSLFLVHHLEQLVREVRFKYPPLVIVRNPIDVFFSQKKHFKSVNITWEIFEKNHPEASKILRDYTSNHTDAGFLKIATHTLHARIVKKLQDQGLIEVVRYEDLLENPEPVLYRLCDLYQLDSSRIPELLKTIKTPSRSDFTNSFRGDVATQKNKWIESMDEHALQEYRAIIKLFHHPYYL